jgi:phasin family protein
MRSGLDAQVNFMTEMTRRTYDTIRKLSELHLNLAQQILQDGTEASRRLLSCRDPFQVVAAAATSAQPVTDHLRDYQQQLFSMFSGVQRELARSAETVAPQASGYALAMAQSMAEMAPGPDAFSAPRSDGRHDGMSDRRAEVRSEGHAERRGNSHTDPRGPAAGVHQPAG